MEMKIEIQPFTVPDYVIAVSKSGLKQDGLVESPKFNIRDIEEQTLSELCDKFRYDVFEKAGKKDTRKTVAVS